MTQTLPHDTLHITVAYFDGTHPDDDGQPYYVASCQEIAATTDGTMWHDLMQNIQELLTVYFAGEDTLQHYGIVPNPRLVITMELPPNYAEIA